MKIVYLITKSEAGGAQTHVGQLCASLKERHSLVVVAYPGGWLEHECNRLGVRFVPNVYFSNSLNPLHMVRSYRRIARIVDEEQPDIVHCHSSVAGFIGRLVVRARIPTLYTAHGWGFNIGVGIVQKWLSICAERMVSVYTKRIICVSSFVHELGIRYHIAPASLSTVIHNGVGPRERAVFETARIRITFVGRLTRPKLPLLLLQAVNGLSEQVKDRVLVSIVGEGQQEKVLQKYIQELLLFGEPI